MQSPKYATALIATLLLCACTEAPLPVMKEPLPVSVPGDGSSFAPRLTQIDTDSAILSWIESSKDGNVLRFAEFGNDAWGEARTAVEDAKMFMNWADLPGVSRTGSGGLLAQWLSYTADATYSYQVLTAQSDDEGESWSPPTSPHSDGTDTEHGFVSLFATAGGTGAVWLDGRNTPDAAMTLRSATISDSGQITAESEIDGSVCDCCQTDVALTDDGPVAVYRGRTEDEIRDIYISRYIDGAWQPGVPINTDGWKIAGCPVNGPTVVADGQRVVVSWFTAAGDIPMVKTAFSTNAGKTFAEPVVLAKGTVSGHVGNAVIDRDTFIVSWLQPEKSAGNAVKIRGLTFSGQMTPVYTVGRTSISRTVPQLVRVKDQLLLAWTNNIGDHDKIVSVRVPIVGFYD